GPGGYGAELGRMNISKRSAILAYRRAGGTQDDDVAASHKRFILNRTALREHVRARARSVRASLQADEEQLRSGRARLRLHPKTLRRRRHFSAPHHLAGAASAQERESRD